MKNIFTLSLLSLFIFNSCEGFLEKSNPNILTDESFWKTEKDFDSAIASVYAPSNINSVFGGRGWEYLCGRSDLYWAEPSNLNAKQACFLSSPDDKYLLERYLGLYKGIFRANHFIHMLHSENQLTEETMKKYEAEARFLRGLYHFTLVRDWVYIPYIEKADFVIEDMLANCTQDMNGDGNVNDADVDIVWERIIDDFKAAVEGLPEMWPPEYLGRATKGAALGFLGKAYLYTRQFAEANVAFEQIIGKGDPCGRPSALGNYKLMPDFEDLWNQKNYDNNCESVYEIQFGLQGGPNLWTDDSEEKSLGSIIARNSTYIGQGWLGIRHFNYYQDEYYKAKPNPSRYFWQYQEFQNDLIKTYVPVHSSDKYQCFDPRFIGSFMTTWSAGGETGIDYGGKVFDKKQGEIGLRKFANWWEPSEIDSSPKNFPLMRYADILLMKAECENELGNVADAIMYIDAIRSRARLPKISETPEVLARMDKAAVRKEIEHQRILEFYGEGLRWYDMQRWEQNPDYPYNVKDTLQAHDNKNNPVRGLHPANYIVGKSERLPFPSVAIDANPSMKQINY